MEKTISRELYLRTIYRLSQELNKVRNVDIAKELGYSKPSVTNAIKKLCADGLIFSDKQNGIRLTENGLVLAEKSTERCDILAEYFIKLGLKKDAAYENARLIGNQITDDLFEPVYTKNIQISVKGETKNGNCQI